MARRGDTKRKMRDLAAKLARSDQVEIKENNGLWKIFDRASGRFLFSMAKTPSDHRAYDNTLALVKHHAIDLNAKKGEKLAARGALHKDPNHLERSKFIRRRIIEILKEVGTSRAEFARFALDAGQKGGIWTYGSESAAAVQLGKFLSGSGASEEAVSLWEYAVNALQSTVEPAAVAEPVPVPAEPLEATGDVEVGEEDVTPPVTVDKDGTFNRDDFVTVAEYEQLSAALDAAREAVRDHQRESQRMAEVVEKQGRQLAKSDEKLNETNTKYRTLQAKVRELEGDLSRARAEHRTATEALAARNNGAPTAPLYVRTLTKLLAAADTEEDVEEAWEIARAVADRAQSRV